MNDPKLHLLYILETIAKIHRLVAKGKAQIEASDDDTAALLFYLHTLAESTQRLPDSLTQTSPDRPRLHSNQYGYYLVCRG